MMIHAGLAEVTQIAEVLEVAHGDFARAFFLHDLLEAAVARGDTTAVEAQDFVDALAQRAREGRFFANAIGYAVVGIRPTSLSA